MGRGLPNTAPNRSVARIVLRNNRKRASPDIRCEPRPATPGRRPKRRDRCRIGRHRGSKVLENVRTSETPRNPQKPPRRPRPRSEPRRPKASGSAKTTKPKNRQGPPTKVLPPVGSRGRSLVIVESPKKAKSINKFLGSKFVVKASMGHVRDLPKRKLGLDVIRGYTPSYEIMPANKKDTIAELKREAAKADTVLPRHRPRPRGARRSPGTSRRRSACPTTASAASSSTRSPRRRSARRSTPCRTDRHGQGERPAGPAVPRPLRRLRAIAPALEEGRPPPQRGEGPVGRRPPDRRPREGDQGVRLRGILADHRAGVSPPARAEEADRFSRRAGRPGRGRNSPPRSRTTPQGHPRRPRRVRLQGLLEVEEVEKFDKPDAPFKTSTLQQQARDPAPVLRQADHEDRPGALRRDRRRRRRPLGPSSLI